MKALILSGGRGTRLRPLTDKIPKTMVEIGGKPILWYHVMHLKRHGVSDIWMALQYLPDVIKDYFGDGSKYGVKITYSVEKKPLGTAGVLKNPNSDIQKEFGKGTFLVVYGDNLTNFDYSKIIKFHKRNKPILTLGLYEAEEPWTMGVVETDSEGKIKRFVEKPPRAEVTTNTVSAGVIVCEPEIFNFIPEGFSDFGFDVLPGLLKNDKVIYALNTHSYVQDTGTIERLTKARNDYKVGKIKI